MRLEKEDEVGVAEIQETTITAEGKDPFERIRHQSVPSAADFDYLIAEVERLRGIITYAALAAARQKKPGDRFTPPKKKRKR